MTTTTEAPRRFKSKTAARAAYDKDAKAFRDAHAATVRAYWLDIKAPLRAALPDWLWEVADLHLPWVPANPKESFYPSCNECRESYGDCVEAPCPTLTLILDQTMPEREKEPDEYAGAFPTPFEHYWPDPYVTVTFAVQTLITDRETGYRWLLNPNDQQTMRHSLAYGIRKRLLTSSRERVEAME